MVRSDCGMEKKKSDEVKEEWSRQLSKRQLSQEGSVGSESLP